MQKSRRKRCRTTNSEHPYPRYDNLMQGLEITRPDQVWVCGNNYIRLSKEFIFLALVAVSTGEFDTINILTHLMSLPVG